MKNFKPLYLIFFSAFILLVVACQPQHDQHVTISSEAIDSMKKAHIIPLEKAVAMYKKYGTDRAGLLADTLKRRYNDPKFKDTRMVWFDINSIKAYLKYLEDNAKDAEGLQFYFSVNGANSDYKNSQTFFIAPTVKNGDHQSGFTHVEGKRVFLYKAFDQKYKANTSKAGFVNLPLADDDGYLYNIGNVSPPDGNN